MPDKEAKGLTTVGKGTSKITGVTASGPGTVVRKVGSLGSDPYTFSEGTRARRGSSKPEGDISKKP